MCKKQSNTLRAVLSSAVGGVYSFIILAKNISWYILYPSKVLAAIVIILIAFKFYRLKSFFVCVFVFLFSNFLFLGIITGICLVTNSDLIVIGNSTVYFNLSAVELLLCAAAAYAVSSVTVRIYNKSVSKGEVYILKIENAGNTVSLFALCDSGNRLREPFSDYPVIVVAKSKVQNLFSSSKPRIIPVTSVNKSSYLYAYKADKITVCMSKGEEVIENAYIALSDEMKDDGFSAIIGTDILTL